MGQKSLCKISDKAYKKDSETIKELVRDANYICRRCFRSARYKGNLCKPEKLNDH